MVSPEHRPEKHASNRSVSDVQDMRPDITSSPSATRAIPQYNESNGITINRSVTTPDVNSDQPIVESYPINRERSGDG